MNLQLDQTYDISKLINFKDVSFWQRLYIRLMLPWGLLLVTLDNLKLLSIRKNPLHDGVRKLSGDKRVALSDQLDFNEIKDASRALGVTINDMVTASLSTAIKKYFVLKGDERSRFIKICVPANIRWSHYKTFESVVLENRFAAIPMLIPLESDLDQALVRVGNVTAQLKT